MKFVKVLNEDCYINVEEIKNIRITRPSMQYFDIQISLFPAMEAAISLCPSAFGCMPSAQYNVLIAPWYLSKGVVMSIIGVCINLEISKSALLYISCQRLMTLISPPNQLNTFSRCSPFMKRLIKEK